MPRVKKLWTNKRFVNQKFIGRYARSGDGNRSFVLSETYFARNIEFDSPQKAKKSGWVQCK